MPTPGRPCGSSRPRAKSTAGAATHSRGPAALNSAPTNPIPGFRVTPGLADLLRIKAVAASGVWVPQNLAQTLAIVPGQRLATSRGELTVAGTYAWPEDGRDARLGYAVLQPIRSSSALDECWAEVWPSTDAADSLIRSTTFVTAAPSEPVTLSQLNLTQGAALDARTDFVSRPSRFALPGGLAAGLVLGFGAIYCRRLEYSAALHCGQRRSAQVATALLETGVWALGGLLVAAAGLGLALQLPAGSTDAEIFLVDVRGPAMGVLGSGLGALSALALIREDRLFRYFKAS